MAAVANRAWWGPRVWRVLHTLAELAEGRGDTESGWRAVLRTTTLMLPCETCREHFGTAIRGWRIPSGVRHGLWVAHATVTTGDPLPFEELGTVYGGGDRAAAVSALVREVGGEFRRGLVLDRFRVGYLEEWERAVRGFLELLRRPPAVQRAGSQGTTPAYSQRAGRQAASSARIPAGSPTSLRGRPTLRDRPRA
jgi:hypothetical protein